MRLMTWRKSQKRWVKKYRGKTYFVSARQLGMPPTEEGSVNAANFWWTAKQAEIDMDAGEVNLVSIKAFRTGDLDKAIADLRQRLETLENMRRLIREIMDERPPMGKARHNLDVVRDKQERINRILDGGKRMGEPSQPEPTGEPMKWSKNGPEMRKIRLRKRLETLREKLSPETSEYIAKKIDKGDLDGAEKVLATEEEWFAMEEAEKSGQQLPG